MKVVKILLILMLLIPATVMAVVPTHTQERRAKLAALRQIEEYETCANLINDEAVENFKFIFVNDSINIYNDLLGLSQKDSLSVDEYIDLLENQKGVLVSLANIQGDKIIDDGDYWLVPITFEKLVQYNTPCGAIISSQDYYDGQAFNMVALVEVNKYTYEGHIRSLKGSVNSDRSRLSPGFAVVNKTDARDLDVKNNGKQMRFNKFDQAFVQSPYNFSYSDDDVKMKVISGGNDECQTFTFEYRPTRWRIKPNVNITIGDAITLDNASELEYSSSAMSFGVDVGYIIPSRNKFKIGIFSGLGISTASLDMSKAGLQYNYNASSDADMDGDTYIRYYELSNLKESIKLSHVTIPVYVDFDYRISRKFSIFANLGFKAYINAGSKVSDLSGDIYSYGIYPQYQNLVVNESWLNDFGDSSFGIDGQSKKSLFRGFSADFLGGIGVRLNVFGPLAIDVAFMYQAPLISRIDDSSLITLPEGNINSSEAPVTYTVRDGQVTDFSFLNYYKAKFNPISLKVGLIFKF